MTNNSLTHTLNREANKVVPSHRDSLLRFNFDDFSKPTDLINLEPDETTKSLCRNRGQPDELCRNFVLVLFTFKDKKIDFQPKIFQDEPRSTSDNASDSEEFLISCGTGAFKPKCTVHALNNLSNITETIDGSLICPHSPWHQFTLLHSEGSCHSPY